MTQLKLFSEQENTSSVALTSNSNSDIPVVLDMMGGVANSRYSDILGRVIFNHDIKPDYIDRLEGYLLFFSINQSDKNTLEFAARGGRTVMKIQNCIIAVLEANGFNVSLQNPVTEERCAVLCNEAKNYRLSIKAKG